MYRQLSIPLTTLTLVLWAFQGCSSATPPPPTDPSEAPEAPPPPAPEPVAPIPEGPPLAAGDAAAPTAPVPGGNACSKDADCVPETCCHPSTCVARAAAPDCKDVMCTMECRPWTLDCGGSCLCQNGQCAAKLNEGKTN